MILVIAWDMGSLVRADAGELAGLGLKPVVLYPSSYDGTHEVDGVLYRPVAITVKSNSSIISAVLASLGDFARAISSLAYDSADPCDLSAFYGYEWAGSTLGSAFKDYFRRPLFTSISSTEGMRSGAGPGGRSLLSMSVSALERRSLHKSDIVLARAPQAFSMVKEEHEVPDDTVKLATGPGDVAAAIRGFLGA